MDPLAAPVPGAPAVTWSAEANGRSQWSGGSVLGQSWEPLPQSPNGSEPEATQTWTMPADPEPPQPPPAEPVAPPVPPVPPMSAAPPAPGAPAENDSIIPDSWFAAPRRPAGDSPLYDPAPAFPNDSTRLDQGAAIPADPGRHFAPGPGQDQWGNAGWPQQPPVPENQTALLDSAFPEQAAPYQAYPDQGYGEQPYPDQAYQAGGYPNGPYAGGPPPRGGQSNNKPLIIAVAALVAIALVAVGIVLWTDRGGEPAAASTPTPKASSGKQPPKKQPPVSGPARQQAVAVHRLFNASAATRNQLGQALASARTCEGLPTAITGFQQVAQRRTAQVNRANALKVSALTKGAQLRDALRRSFQLSLQTDQAFLAWAQGAQGERCRRRPRPDANYQRGNSLSAQATNAKQEVSTLWNPIARKVNLPTRTSTQF